jgi:hypothetical protein
MLAVATLSVAVMRINLRYRLSYTSAVATDTRGELYFESIFALSWGTVVMELSAVGVFLLKANARHLSQDIAQVSVMLVGLYFSVRYDRWLKGHFRSIIADQEGALADQSTPSDDPDVKDCRVMSGTKDYALEESVDKNVIWIGRDKFGFSDALVAFVQARYFPDYCNGDAITNMRVSMDAEGIVAVDKATAHRSFEESPS